MVDKNETFSTQQEILDWIDNLNKETTLEINRVPFSSSSYWGYSPEKSKISNRNNAFFEIVGVEYNKNSKKFNQPILIQNEIGFLGLLAKKIKGNYYFLIQAKIEPGNPNKIQLSPTLQATKSNFEKKHGGKSPKFLNYFDSPVSDNLILYDQLHSEHSSFFFKKRNRIKIVLTTDYIKLDSTYRWLNFSQLLQMLNYNNILNMSLRSILGCFHYLNYSTFKSYPSNNLNYLFNLLNSYKMHHLASVNTIALNCLSDWELNSNFVEGKFDDSNFRISYFEIKIPNREVSNWEQPLIEGIQKREIILISRLFENEMQYLVKLTEEIGSFDIAEFGPTINQAVLSLPSNNSELTVTSFYNLNDFKTLFSVELAEEGGRFFNFINQYSIIEFSDSRDLNELEGFKWINKKDLSFLVSLEGKANIFLRTFLLMIEAAKL